MSASVGTVGSEARVTGEAAVRVVEAARKVDEQTEALDRYVGDFVRQRPRPALTARPASVAIRSTVMTFVASAPCGRAARCLMVRLPKETLTKRTSP